MEVKDKEFAPEGECRWTARDRVVIARMEQYLDKSESMKVEIEELELLLGPEDSQVDLEYHLCKNNYRFDVVQIYCFRINIKL